MIRNKKNHYRDLPLAVRTELGPIPEGFLHYFTSRFPALLIYVYSVLSCFCLESPASSLGDTYSYSPLDLDHADADHEVEREARSVLQAFYHKPLRDYPRLRFSSPQFEQFYAMISLRRLVQLQKHTRLRFRHWYVQEDAWMPRPQPPAAATAAAAAAPTPDELRFEEEDLDADPHQPGASSSPSQPSRDVAAAAAAATAAAAAAAAPAPSEFRHFTRSASV